MIMRGRMIDEDLAVGNLPALSLKGLRTQRRLRREMKQLQRIIEDLRADRQRYLGSKSKSVWMELEEQNPIQRNPPKKTKKKQQNVNRNRTMRTSNGTPKRERIQYSSKMTARKITPIHRKRKVARE